MWTLNPSKPLGFGLTSLITDDRFGARQFENRRARAADGWPRATSNHAWLQIFPRRLAERCGGTRVGLRHHKHYEGDRDASRIDTGSCFASKDRGGDGVVGTRANGRQVSDADRSFGHA